MATTRTAHTVWTGSLTEGSGNTTLDSSGLGTFDVTWKARTEAAGGKTSPEELIAAAHSGCFAMKLSFSLQEAGFTAEDLTVTCAINFENGAITESALTLKAKVPGISKEKFDECAADAKANCPISKLLNTKITLDAQLV